MEDTPTYVHLNIGSRCSFPQPNTLTHGPDARGSRGSAATPSLAKQHGELVGQEGGERLELCVVEQRWMDEKAHDEVGTG